MITRAQTLQHPQLLSLRHYSFFAGEPTRIKAHLHRFVSAKPPRHRSLLPWEAAAARGGAGAAGCQIRM